MKHSQPPICVNILISLLAGAFLAGCVEAEIVSESLGLKALNETLPKDYRYEPVSKNFLKIIDGGRWNSYLMGKRDKLYLHDEVDKANDPNAPCYDHARASLTRHENRPEILDLTAKAERGDANAQLNLGAMYNQSRDMKDRYIAWTWFQCAADLGHPMAQFMVGAMYAERIAQPAKINEAVKWYTLAAEQNYVDAQLALGVLYADMRSDRKASREWLDRAAKNGSEKAKTLLEAKISSEESERRKVETALLRIQETKAQSQQDGDPEQQSGQPAGPELEDQAEKERQAAAKDLALKITESELAVRKAAEERAKERNLIQERALAQAKAIEARNLALAEAKAAKEQASIAGKPPSAAGDQKEGKADEAKTDKSSGDAEALFQTAYAYDASDGVEKNMAKAMEHYKLAADLGNAAAQFNLGLIYLMGKGGEKDPVKAAKLFNLAANQGHAGAQHNLALMHYLGDGVAKDFAESVRWHLAAAEQGEAASQEALSALYRDGQGVSQDYVQANKWLEIALANEIPDVLRETWLKRQELLTKRLTAEQVEESKRQANEWSMKQKGAAPENPPENPAENPAEK